MSVTLYVLPAMCSATPWILAASLDPVSLNSLREMSLSSVFTAASPLPVEFSSSPDAPAPPAGVGGRALVATADPLRSAADESVISPPASTDA